MRFRHSFSVLDHWLIGAERVLASAFGATIGPSRPSPATSVASSDLTEDERHHSAGLMRINHTGEVCAQALYSGQAAVSREPHTRQHLLAAAVEETDHLAWCLERLDQLSAKPSIANPVWYAGSFALGALAGLAGDAISLGFVVETERQVEAHLEDHLRRLPSNDGRSRAIVSRMQIEEAGHAHAAKAAGGADLPPPIPALMGLASRVMKWTAYRF